MEQIVDKPRTLTELTKFHCHWPLWPHDLPKPPPHDEAFYCGRPVEPDRCYCKHHMKMARRVNKDD